MKRKSTQPLPPRLALAIARLFVSGDRRGEVDGDLRELYDRVRERHGRRRASWRCWREAVLCAAWRLPRSILRFHPHPIGHFGDVMRALMQDVRYAVRGLRRAPGFALLAAGTLALGIGANVALFSAAYGVLWRPLQIPESGRVIYLFQRNDAAGERRQPAAPETFHFWRDYASTVEAVGAWVFTSVTLEHPDGAEELDATLLVDGDFFRVLGTPPLHGRPLRDDDGVAGRTGSVVVLGHDIWQRRFAADPGVVGRTVVLDGAPHAVVGVMPPDLDIPQAGIDAWLPRGFALEERAMIGRLNIAARMVDEASPDAVQAEVAGLATQLAEISPAVHAGWETDVVPVRDDLIGDSRRGLLFALSAVGLVLLMACVNVANLLLARAVTRQREWALRSALGAGRSEVVRLVVVESLVVAVLGGAIGLAAAALVHTGLVRLAADILPRAGAIRLDWPVLVFGMAASVAAGLVFAVAPALHTVGRDAMTALRNSAGAGSGRRAHGIRTALVGVQVALAVPMLIGAALLLQSLRELQRVDPGFDPRGVTAARVFLDRTAYPDSDSRRGYFRDLLEQLASLPGVVATGAASGLPLDPVGIDFSSPIDVPGRPLGDGESRPRADHRVVTPGYLETIGLPLVRGRFLTDADRESTQRAIVINQTLANQLWDGEDPVGRTVSVPFFGVNDYIVVGIVGDVRFRGLATEPRPEMYTAHQQGPFGSMTVAVRTAGDANALVEPLRAAVLQLDPKQPVHSIVTADQLVAGAMSAERFYSTVSLLFAVVALMLAAGGLYGVMAYGVRQRTREIGVLLALGARPRQVTRQIVVRGVLVAGGGAAVGAMFAIGTARVLRGMLFGVSNVDPLVLGAVIALLLSAVLVAAYVPARNAARIDPVLALRHE